jgi:5,10-methylene-tetrahydrofolate dehydrogenase/methenyl tetrahydrofolate cyclohydrolase
VKDFKVSVQSLRDLCTVLVGSDPASQVYVRNKGKAASARQDLKLSKDTVRDD